MKTLFVVSALLGTLLALGSGQASANTSCSFTSGTTMKLLGNCTTDATILVPNGATLDGQGHTITAVDPSGGHFLGAVVMNGGAVANVKNLKIATSGLSDFCDSGTSVLRGIQFDGARGSIVGNTISGINQGSSSTCTEGNGIVVSDPVQNGTHPATKPVAIVGNQIVDAQQLGITVLGDVSATIAGNKIVGGVGAPALRVGINIGNGALGSIVLNSITHPASDNDSAGIRVAASSGLLISGNAVSGSREGIFVTSTCSVGAPANGNQILLNTLRVALEGVDLIARTASTSLCDPHVDQNVVAGNVVQPVTAPGGAGVFVGAQDNDGGGGFTPVANANVVKGNVIKQFTDPVFRNGFDTNTVVANNVIVP